MLLSRILGGIGRVFISTGVLTLLFVAYQLWGTGFIEARAQGSLENELEDIFAEATALQEELSGEFAVVGDDTDGVPNPEPVSTTPADPGTENEPAPEGEAVVEAEPVIDQRIIDLVWKEEGTSVAQILIPKIGVSKFVIEGVGVDELREGPGHYPSTPMPGMPGNSSIAGHRTTYGAPFGDIDQLVPGDVITVRTAQGIFDYAVIEQESGKGHFIVSPDRVDVLDQDFEESPNRLTLTACHPKYTARQRIIVVAELISEPAQFIPRPDDLEKLTNPEVPGEEIPTEDNSQTLGANEGEGEDGGEREPGAEPEVVLPQDAIDNALGEEDGTATGGVVEGADAGDEVEIADPTPEPIAEPEPEDEPDFDPLAVAFTEGEDDFGEGLNGDSAAVTPAILWGIAAAAIWLAAWFVGTRWRKWPSYAIGIVPFAVVLFICFVYIDRALPSY